MWRSLSEDVKPDGANGVEDFETAETFEDDAYVLYTYSQSADEVKSVALAEEVTGTVTRAENSVKDEDETKAPSPSTAPSTTPPRPSLARASGNVSVDEDYTVYLDAYGYVISVEQSDEITATTPCWSGHPGFQGAPAPRLTALKLVLDRRH